MGTLMTVLLIVIVVATYSGLVGRLILFIEKVWKNAKARATRLEEPNLLRYTAVSTPRPGVHQPKFDVLQAAVKRLYLSGMWRCSTLSHEAQVKLWTDLRDAAEIPAGTATAAGIGEKMVIIPAEGKGIMWTKEEAVLEWKVAGLDLNENCLCVDCPYLDTCEWAYDLYNTKPGEPGWDCLGGK